MVIDDRWHMVDLFALLFTYSTVNPHRTRALGQIDNPVGRYKFRLESGYSHANARIPFQIHSSR